MTTPATTTRQWQSDTGVFVLASEAVGIKQDQLDTGVFINETVEAVLPVLLMGRACL